jgi:hypothetical protein
MMEDNKLKEIIIFQEEFNIWLLDSVFYFYNIISIIITLSMVAIHNLY